MASLLPETCVRTLAVRYHGVTTPTSCSLARLRQLGSQDDERVYVRLVHDHRMQALPVTGLGCACHDGLVGIYSEARLRAWSLRMKASAELASWCCHVKLVMSQFFAGTPCGSCLSTHRCRCLGLRSWLQLCT
jgi:hypothetical protein